MPYTHFTTAQVAYLRTHYAEHPATHFAQLWDTTPAKVRALARRQQVKRRAPNGQPVWRGKARVWALGGRWA
jgi:hypothetical protein